jgi:predicted AAA+ superfamily ATPase
LRAKRGKTGSIYKYATETCLTRFARNDGAFAFSLAIGIDALYIDLLNTGTYFDIVEDLLLGMKIPVFTRRAQRQLVSHPKFYFFDVGIYRTIRPRGILDTDDEIDGAGLETLFLQHLLAINDYYRLGYQIYFWRTRNNVEVDFILYGEHGLHAFAIKRKTKLDHKDFSGLKAFAKDYPMANLILVYGGNETLYIDNIKVIPLEQALFALPQILQQTT